MKLHYMVRLIKKVVAVGRSTGYSSASSTGSRIINMGDDGYSIADRLVFIPKTGCNLFGTHTTDVARKDFCNYGFLPFELYSHDGDYKTTGLTLEHYLVERVFKPAIDSCNKAKGVGNEDVQKLLACVFGTRSFIMNDNIMTLSPKFGVVKDALQYTDLTVKSSDSVELKALKSSLNQLQEGGYFGDRYNGFYPKKVSLQSSFASLYDTNLKAGLTGLDFGTYSEDLTQRPPHPLSVSGVGSQDTRISMQVQVCAVLDIKRNPGDVYSNFIFELRAQCDNLMPQGTNVQGVEISVPLRLFLDMRSKLLKAHIELYKSLGDKISGDKKWGDILGEAWGGVVSDNIDENFVENLLSKNKIKISGYASTVNADIADILKKMKIIELANKHLYGFTRVVWNSMGIRKKLIESSNGESPISNPVPKKTLRRSTETHSEATGITNLTYDTRVSYNPSRTRATLLRSGFSSKSKKENYGDFSVFNDKGNTCLKKVFLPVLGSATHMETYLKMEKEIILYGAVKLFKEAKPSISVEDALLLAEYNYLTVGIDGPTSMLGRDTDNIITVGGLAETSDSSDIVSEPAFNCWTLEHSEARTLMNIKRDLPILRHYSNLVHSEDDFIRGLAFEDRHEIARLLVQNPNAELIDLVGTVFKSYGFPDDDEPENLEHKNILQRRSSQMGVVVAAAATAQQTVKIGEYETFPASNSALFEGSVFKDTFIKNFSELDQSCANKCISILFGRVNNPQAPFCEDKLRAAINDKNPGLGEFDKKKVDKIVLAMKGWVDKFAGGGSKGAELKSKFLEYARERRDEK